MEPQYMKRKRESPGQYAFWPHGYWTRTDCKEHADCLFVFGDNDVRKGIKGQAVIRYAPNTIGVPTKKLPLRGGQGVYYTDDEQEQNERKIDAALHQIADKADMYRIVYFPSDGLGTGLSRMPEYAPNTLQYLVNQIKLKFGLDLPTTSSK